VADLRDLWRWFGADWGRVLSAFAAVVVFGWMASTIAQQSYHNRTVLARMERLSKEQNEERILRYNQLAAELKAALDDATDAQLVTINGYFSQASDSMRLITARRDAVVREIAAKVGISPKVIDRIFEASHEGEAYPHTHTK
jgi:uncharacterized protein YdbL (DUF1318 family)